MLQGTADALLAGLGDKERGGAWHEVQSRASADRLASRVSVRFKPGLLFFPRDGMRGTLESKGTKVANAGDALRIPSWDEASMLGLSVSALRGLALSSDSWVCFSLT